jgi:hypothetical protein
MKCKCGNDAIEKHFHTFNYYYCPKCKIEVGGKHQPYLEAGDVIVCSECKSSYGEIKKDTKYLPNNSDLLNINKSLKDYVETIATIYTSGIYWYPFGACNKSLCHGEYAKIIIGTGEIRIFTYKKGWVG